MRVNGAVGDLWPGEALSETPVVVRSGTNDAMKAPGHGKVDSYGRVMKFAQVFDLIDSFQKDVSAWREAASKALAVQGTADIPLTLYGLLNRKNKELVPVKIAMIDDLISFVNKKKPGSLSRLSTEDGGFAIRIENEHVYERKGIVNVIEEWLRGQRRRYEGMSSMQNPDTELAALAKEEIPWEAMKGWQTVGQELHSPVFYELTLHSSGDNRDYSAEIYFMRGPGTGMTAVRLTDRTGGKQSQKLFHVSLHGRLDGEDVWPQIVTAIQAQVKAVAASGMVRQMKDWTVTEE
jgi:hypothetical protein